MGDLARPGGNVTGISGFSPELVAKRLQLLRDILPKADHVGVLANLANPSAPPVVRAAETAGRQSNVQVHVADVREAKALAVAFDKLVRQGVDALLVVSDPMIHDQAARIVELTTRHRLPALYESPMFPDAGGLLSYGPGRFDRFQRAAVYVDRILRGARPAELPIERPTKFELILNLKAAKALGLSIPQSVIVQADQIIR